jgi:glycosyltransferase involved in cell wall biosynthesis
MNKKVLVIGMSPNIGGTETFIMTRCRALFETNIHFDFLVTTPHIAFESEILSLGSKIFHITQRKKNRLKFHRELKSFFKEHADDYEAVWYNANNLANIDYLSYAKRFGVRKRIIHCHNSANPDNWVRGLLHVLNRTRIASIATHFWTASNEASKWFYGSNFSTLPHYSVVPNAINPNTFKYEPSKRSKVRKELGIPDDSLVMGNLGRLQSQKNQSFLLQIFREFLNKHDDAFLVIIGDGPLNEQLKKQSEKLNITDRVHFLGLVQQPSALYSVMDLFVFPSIFEALPVSILEAQANGLPCLASEATPCTAIINNNVRRCSLDKSTLYWARKCDELLSVGRVDNDANLIGTSKYNISKQITWLQKNL